MRLAQIDGETVVNVIIVTSDDIPDWCADWPQSYEAGPGWSYIDGEFFPPPEQLEE